MKKQFTIIVPHGNSTFNYNVWRPKTVLQRILDSIVLLYYTPHLQEHTDNSTLLQYITITLHIVPVTSPWLSLALIHLWNLRSRCLCSWDIQVFSTPFNHNRTIYHLTFYTLQALAQRIQHNLDFIQRQLIKHLFH